MKHMYLVYIHEHKEIKHIHICSTQIKTYASFGSTILFCTYFS